tara:strand:+ start:230 stop:466 length:237 start_codon:yes stop_codon:yes gene_type:complete
MGINCKGNCRLFVLPKPHLGKYSAPYLTHGRCRVCDIWIPLRGGVGPFKNRCPCCSSIYAVRPRLTSKRLRYKELLKK